MKKKLEKRFTKNPNTVESYACNGCYCSGCNYPFCSGDWQYYADINSTQKFVASREGTKYS